VLSNDRGTAIWNRAAGGYLRQALAAVAVVLLATACAPFGSTVPTPTPANPAPVVLATAVPTPQLAVRLSPTPSVTLVAVALPPTATPVPEIRPVYVSGTGADGLTLRRTPSSGGEPIAVMRDGTPLTPTGQDQQADGRLWRQVKDAQGREGWVAADFLSDAAPALAGASPVTDDLTAPPTRAVSVPPPPLPPTSVPPPPLPPTRPPTRAPETPVRVAPSTPRPQAPAAAPTPTRSGTAGPAIASTAVLPSRFFPSQGTPTPTRGSGQP